MELTTVLAILNVIFSFLTIIAQMLQSLLDYKRDKLNNQNRLYEYKEYSSNCCVVIEDNSE